MRRQTQSFLFFGFALGVALIIAYGVYTALENQNLLLKIRLDQLNKSNQNHALPTQR